LQVERREGSDRESGKTKGMPFGLKRPLLFRTHGLPWWG
jgi:hypothetical protein